MGRAPCCDEVGLKKGPWTPEEDEKLVDFIRRHGHGSWRNLPKKAGLNRCGKSCRLRWTNYLRPDIKRGKFSDEEEQIIIQLHSILGNKWSTISKGLPGRTDNEIKNYWNTHLKKKLLLMGIDPVTHRRRTDLDLITSLPNIIAAAAAAATGNLGRIPLNDVLRLQADAVHFVKLQVLQTLIQAMSATSAAANSSEIINNPTGSAASYHQILDDGLTQLISDCSPDPLPPPPPPLSARSDPQSAGDHEKFQQVSPDHESSAYPNTTSNNSSGVVNLTAADYCINSSSSPASTPFQQGLHDDLGVGELYVDSMICWKDVIDQISWATASSESYDDQGGLQS